MSTFTVIDVETKASWYTQPIWRSSGVPIEVVNNTDSDRLLDSILLQFVAGNTGGKSISFSGSESTVTGTGSGTSLALYQNDKCVSKIVTIPAMPKANVYCPGGPGTSDNLSTWFQPRCRLDGTIQNLDSTWTYEKTQYSFKMESPISIPAKGSSLFTIKSVDTADVITTIIQMGVITGEEASELVSFIWRYDAAAKQWEKVLIPKRYNKSKGTWEDLLSAHRYQDKSWSNTL